MNILLDTHIVLWWLANDPLLTQKARELIADSGNVIFISAVTVWEIQIKRSIGKLRIADNFLEHLPPDLFETLPLTAVQAAAVGSLPWHHKDPFDRILIAQAQTERLHLLTSDAPLTQYGDFVIIA